MADSKITKKPHPSLSRRITLISLLFLVIPLLLQNFFLYWQEYDQKIEEAKSGLEVLAKERAHSIEELIQRNWQFLDAMPPPNPLDCPSHVKGFYIETMPLPPRVEDHFVLVSQKRNALLIGKRDSATSALVIPLPFNDIVKNLSTPDDIRLALLDSKGDLVFENMPRRKESEILEIQEPIPQTNLRLEITLPTKLIHGPHFSNYMYRFATLLFFVGILGGGAVTLLTRRMGKPLNALCKTMRRVSEGAIHARYTQDRMGFEINDLGLQFNETLDELLRSSKEIEKEKLAREKLAEELRIGHEIQANLLPKNIPGVHGIDIGTEYLAAQEVNGDFYDFYPLENGHLLVAICDTAGKGISACLYSLGLRSILKTVASLSKTLEEIVQKTNDLYYMDAQNLSMFSTLWLGIYNPKKRLLTYCSQGHPPALLVHDQEIIELSTKGVALGTEKLKKIAVQEISIDPKDKLILYTDGVIEAHNPEREVYGKKRLHAFALKMNHSAAKNAHELIEEVHSFTKNAMQHDDITVVILQFEE